LPGDAFNADDKKRFFVDYKIYAERVVMVDAVEKIMGIRERVIRKDKNAGFFNGKFCRFSDIGLEGDEVVAAIVSKSGRGKRQKQGNKERFHDAGEWSGRFQPSRQKRGTK
jgi:hypothetical protein